MLKMEEKNGVDHIDMSYPCVIEKRTPKLSPRDVDTSCISAMTFDSCSHLQSCCTEISIHTGEVQSNEKRIDNTPIVKGSLYSRIMNGLQDLGGDSVRAVPIPMEQDQAKSSFGASDLHTNVDVDENSVDAISIVEEIMMKVEQESIQVSEDLILEPTQLDKNESDQEVTMATNDDEGSGIRISKYYDNILKDCNKDVADDVIVDQWREVLDSRSGKSYYYNRRTRESRWTLPASGILSKKRRNIHVGQDTRMTSSCTLQQILMSGITENKSAYRENHQGIDSFVRYKASSFNDECLFPSQGSNAETRTIDAEELYVEREKEQTLFCMYCGTSIRSVNNMQKHLHLECSRYQDYHSCNRLKHDELISNLEKMWHNMGDNINKENESPNLRITRNHVQACVFDKYRNKKESEDIFSVSDDEKTVIDNDIRCRYKKSLESNEEVSSSCAFCNKVFKSGFLLSNHLLVCKKRRQSKRRRSPLCHHNEL